MFVLLLLALIVGLWLALTSWLAYTDARSAGWRLAAKMKASCQLSYSDGCGWELDEVPVGDLLDSAIWYLQFKNSLVESHKSVVPNNNDSGLLLAVRTYYKLKETDE